MILSKPKLLSSAIPILFAIATNANAGTILLTQFDYSGYTTMAANLEVDGHTVDIVDARSGGSVASALATGSYDQVFLWDLTSSQYLNSDDISAINSFWSPSQGIVVDSRSYGYYFQGNNASEVALIQNVADALDLSGGGIWIGTDHEPQWTMNANPVLAALGFDQITGLYSDPVNVADPTSFLLDGVTPTELWGGGASVGRTHIGEQPNGVDMYMHFGHQYEDGSVLPYISASFDLEGPTPVEGPTPPDGPTPVAVAEPNTFTILALALMGIGVVRHKRKMRNLPC